MPPNPARNGGLAIISVPPPPPAGSITLVAQSIAYSKIIKLKCKRVENNSSGVIMEKFYTDLTRTMRI
jgi:hypothetical protein